MGKKILVVDDSKFTRSLLKAALERFGFWVDEAESPSDALAIVQLKKPDLLISDLKMPELMDGLGFLRLLALEDEDLPVIVYTSDAKAREEVGDVGLLKLFFLTKPASPTKLRECVERMTGMSV